MSVKVSNASSVLTKRTGCDGHESTFISEPRTKPVGLVSWSFASDAAVILLEYNLD